MSDNKKSETKGGRGCVIRRCTCQHSYQDSLYGQGMRVMNKTTKGSGRCTVCSKEAA